MNLSRSVDTFLITPAPTFLLNFLVTYTRSGCISELHTLGQVKRPLSGDARHIYNCAQKIRD